MTIIGGIMKTGKTTVFIVAQRCKSILASYWEVRLNTIKVDAKGSKDDIYTSKVKYILKKGRPYIWIPEKDMHNVNTIIDEQASLAVASPYLGPLAKLLRSLKKSQLAMESVREVIQSEQRLINESTHTVSGVLSSSNFISTSRSESRKELVDGGERYWLYSSCLFVDGNGRTHEVDLEDMGTSKVDPLASVYAKFIDGINQSEARHRALILFCFVYMNANTRKVPSPVIKDGLGEYQWKEFRFLFKEEACDVETFCRQLVEMEEEAVKKVSSFSGLT